MSDLLATPRPPASLRTPAKPPAKSPNPAGRRYPRHLAPEPKDLPAPPDDPNSTILLTLNDSAAFALSPPASPQVSRHGSGAGAAANLAPAKKNLLARRGSGAEPIRTRGNHLTLREQEKVIDEVKKENFNLKLKIYFLEDRLAKLAPDQVDLALKENVEIKVEFQTVRQELKRYKRLLLEAERAIELAKADRDELLQQQQQFAASNEKRAGRGLESELRQVKEELAAKNRANRVLEDELRLARNKLDRAVSKENQRSELAEDWTSEEHLLEIKNLKTELSEERQLKEDLIGDNQDLRHRLMETKNALLDSRDEFQRTQRSSQLSRTQSRLEDHDDYLGRKSMATPGSATTTPGGKVRDLRKELDGMHKQVNDLEDENACLRSQINSQVTMISNKNAEKDRLQDQIHHLKRQIIELEDELERGDREMESLQHGERLQDASDGLREELNVYRDKLASALLALEKREKEIDELTAELRERDTHYSEQLGGVNRQYSSELQSLKAHRGELQELLEEREDQVGELSEQLREVIGLQEETEKALRDVSERLESKEEDYSALAKELEATQADLREIGAGNRELAAEVTEKEQQLNNLNADLDSVEQEANNRAAVSEQVVNKLKQKLTTAKSELSELTRQHESCMSEVKFLRGKQEEMTSRHAELDMKRRNEMEAKRSLEKEVDHLEGELRTVREEMELQIVAAKKEKRELQASSQHALEGKQKSLLQAESDLSNLKARLQVREEDLEKLQTHLKTFENEVNQSQSHDRFSLELEVERLQKDLAATVKELDAAEAEKNTMHNELKSAQLSVSSLQSDRDELSDKLVGIERMKKELNEKFEEQIKSLRETQGELANAKNRLQYLEDELSQEHKQLSKTENQYRQQLSERNTLLLTIYQFLDKLSSNSHGSRRSTGTGDPKPFSNFSVFHDSVINRLKGLGAVQSGFETKVKEVENRLDKQYAVLKRQHDSRMRQLDQFETTVKAASDTQRQWRARLATKQSEVEAARETCTELQKQISSLKYRASLAGSSPGSITEQRQATNRASHLEKRLLATQTQLKATEDKFNEAKVKVSAVEASWQARLKELQERNRELEEKVKRERQGAKERKNELDSQVVLLKEQVEASERRGKQLESMLKS